MPIKIAIEHTVSEQFFHDLMVTMVEQSYGWFAFKNVVRDDNKLNVLAFEVHEWDEDNEESVDEFSDGWETVTPLSIVETIKDILEKRPIRADLIAQIERAVAEDSADIDADAADCILQWTVFDEVRYG